MTENYGDVTTFHGLIYAAAEFAEEAHRDQVDKLGEAYIQHPHRVSMYVGEDATLKAIAWLHDVIEDTDVTEFDLREAGFPPDVVAAVVDLTHLPNEPYRDYLARVKTNPLAVKVKLADIRDNTDPRRLDRLDSETRERLHKKYTEAREFLLA